ncbi:MAG: class II aldolase/adducin family protein [Anaerolineales bacterium]|nr:class II aldolase/adducin family protein [Anaerolineales bacterium]
MIISPSPTLDEFLTTIGEVGQRLDNLQACEGAAGNISICLRGPIDLSLHFPLTSEIELPQNAPGLAGATILVSGSGRRLHEIRNDPPAHLAAVGINKGGRTATLHTSPRRRFEQVTSEFNSHLAVHSDRFRSTGANFHALIHAQPIYLSFLSHIPRYQDPAYLNNHLLRWQPETILNLPEGIGVIPFLIPGSAELVAANVENLRKHQLVIWAKHGIMARSDSSINQAADRIEYAETAARYEYLNLAIGEIGEGLSADEIRSIYQAVQPPADRFSM